MNETQQTLMDAIDELGRTASRIADERNALMKLVRQAISTNPTDSAAWNRWIDEAQSTLEGFAE